MWKIAGSKEVEEIYFLEGNAGMEELGEKLEKGENWEETAEIARQAGIDLVVVGPEQPLVEGVVDVFSEKGIKIFGPSKEASQLEGSKAFAKELMRKYRVPTAEFEVFTSPEEAIRFLEKKEYPLVVKADGLAAGKGSIICKNFEEARKQVERIMVERIFGEAGEKVVVEEFLEGDEASIIALTDGVNIKFLLPSQDHKAVFDGDKGPNTGGMGAYAPCPLIDSSLHREIQEKVMRRTLEGMGKEGIAFQGVLYAGLMITREGPKVLEFNVRFGDPETQAILPLLETDLIEVIMGVMEGRLKKIHLKWREGYCVCVVLASGGYPGKYEKGKEIKGVEEAMDLPEITIFHAGTKKEKETLFTDGGRVMGVTAWGEDIQQARKRVYQAIDKIHFEGMHYRKDIGLKALKYLSGKRFQRT